jgi:hypothetical protein
LRPEGFGRTLAAVSAPAVNFVKPFAIAGFILGELIMLYCVLAPNLKGSAPPPVDAVIMRVLVGSIFFGPFGMAAGTGLGMLVSGLVNSRRGRKQPPATTENPQA